MFEWLRSFCHDKLGWHNGNGPHWFDGISEHGLCSRCGLEVMRDSQGNWFTLG